MPIHIRQKNSSLDEDKAYTVVYTEDWTENLSLHPCVLERPDKFEIVNNDIPEDVQYLRYQ